MAVEPVGARGEYDAGAYGLVDSEEVAEVDLPREGPFVKDLRWHEKY